MKAFHINFDHANILFKKEFSPGMHPLQMQTVITLLTQWDHDCCTCQAAWNKAALKKKLCISLPFGTINLCLLAVKGSNTIFHIELVELSSKHINVGIKILFSVSHPDSKLIGHHIHIGTCLL